MFKKILVLSILASSVLFAKLTVTTTIYPLYSVVKEVGGKNVVLNNLIPFGTEPHDFEPNPKSMALLSKSDLFITSGKVMEPWSTKVIKSMEIADKTFDMSKHVKLATHKEFEDGKVYDPHYWLSFDNYIKMIKNIESLLIKKDPANKKSYQKNASTYLKKITTLQAKYQTLKTCKNRKVVVNHDAFGYLANDYGITQYSISGMSPDEEPSAKQIAELIKIVKKENIHTIFFEEFASDKIAKTIADEANVKTDELSPVENITKKQNEENVGFVSIMTENLTKLKDAMNCQ